MSFPGHAKSFKLDRQRSQAQPTDSSPDPCSPALYGEPTTHQNHERQAGSFSSAHNRVYVQNAEVAASDIKDDCENKATRHIWIGNTGEGRTKREVGALLGQKGRIESIRIFNHQGGFMFVNYEEGKEMDGVCEGTYAAIAAWRDFHEADIFRRGQPVWVRFTVPENVARKARAMERNETWNPARDMPPKETFHNDPLRNERPRFDSNANDFSPPTGPRAERFGVLPPAGPRAMRRSISPPALRCGDTYRPLERSIRDEPPYQAAQRRTSGRMREDDLYRPNYDVEQDPVRRDSEQDCTPRHEFRTTIRLSNNPNSGLEDSETSAIRERQTSNASATVKPAQESDALLQKLPVQDETQGMEIKGLAQSLHHTTAKEAEELGPTELEISIKGAAARTQNKESEIMSTEFGESIDDHKGFAFLSTLYESRDHALSTTTINTKNRRLKSPLDGVRATNDETGSVMSDQTSSTRTSSIRKKNCAKCEKPETTISTLSLKCSLCPRRFHSSCVTSCSPAAEGANFICGRCLRKQKARAALQDTIAPSSPTLAVTSTTSATEVVLPTSNFEVSDNYQDVNAYNADTVTSKTDDASVSIPRPVPMETAWDTPWNVKQEFAQTTANHNFIRANKENLPPTGLSSGYRLPERAASLLKEQIDFEEARAVAEKYKRDVTCPWWEKGDCRRREDDCLFAHERTEIGSPRLPRYSKSWTCYRWKFTSRGCSDKDCAHAHHDTGLYVGVDGAPRKKHLTCFYWRIKGHCGKHEDECVFTHRDTGFMAEAPTSFVPMPARDSYRGTSGEYFRRGQQFPQHTPVHDANSQRHQQISDDFVTTASPVPYTPSIAEHASLAEPPQPFDENASPNVDDELTIPQANRQSVELTNLAEHQETSDPLVDRPKQFARPGGRKPGQPPGDPRKRKPQASTSQVTTDLVSTEPMTMMAVDINDVSKFKADTEISPAISPAVQATVSKHISMRECKSCGKKVFQSDTCRSCQDPLKRPAEDKSLNDMETTTTNEENPPTEDAVQHDKDAQLDSMISEEFDDHPTRDKSPPKVLKRAPSGSNMFLPNKRQRPNPSTLSIVTAPKVRVHGTKIIAGQPNIQSLIQHVKADKVAANSPSAETGQNIDDSMIYEPSEAPASPERRPIDIEEAQSIPPLTPTSTYSPPFDITELNIIAGPVDTSPAAPTIESFSAHEQEQDLLDKQLMETTQTSTMMNNEVVELQKWMRVPEPRTSPLRRPPSPSSDGESDVPLAANYEARRRDQEGQSSLLKNNSPLSRPLSAGQACESCRQRRRKCLHKADAHSELDPEKCFVDMKARIARGGSYTDRSFLEVQLIEKAAAMWAKSQGKLEPAILLARKEHEERSGASRSATSAEDIVNHNLVASDEETERSSRTSPPGDADDTIDDHDKVTSSDANSAKAHTSKPVVRSPHKRTAPEITTRSSASRAAIVGTMKTSPSKKHEKPTETARLVRQDLNQSEAEKTTNRSPARLRLIMKSHDRATAMARLKAQGVEFESSEEEDYEDEIPQFGNPAPSKLWQTATQPKAIDPLLNYKHTRAKITWPTSTTTSQNETLSQSTHNLKLTKRQGLKNRLLLRQHQMFRNLYLTGNAHHEVNREQSQALLRATVQRKVPHDNASRDKLAPDSIMTKEEIMSFQEFLGVPQDVELEPCLFGPTQGLAFREKGDDAFGIGLGGGYVGMRNRRRVLEGEKWPVSER